MTRLMNEGVSWSGRERNCCFVNLGDGTFADGSAITGLDFLDDGRAAATVDWDGDGDLDLWLRNRTGPQLRLMRNNSGGKGHFLALRLTGRTCNRDAIGAVVEVQVGPRRLTRAVTAGEGYLAQSSKWLHFGLGASDRVERIVVRWPGAESQELPGLPVDRRYHLEQGSAPAPLPERSCILAPAPADAPPRPGGSAPPEGTRAVLRTPLPLPPILTTGSFGKQTGGRARVINLWAQWCAPCLAELSAWSAEHERLRAAGIHILALNVDEPANRARAERLFSERVGPGARAATLAEQAATEPLLETLEAILHHVGDKPGAWPVPTSLLTDATGTLQVVYFGPTTPAQLVADTEAYCTGRVPMSRRGAYGGRWFFKVPRNLNALSADLKQRGRREEARFYVAMSQARGPASPR